MSARVVLTGFEELRAALRQLPSELTEEATFIVKAAAEEAARRIVDRYPTVEGNLKDGVKVRDLSVGKFGVGKQVRSTARHAHLYEYGTQVRHTDLGYNRGSMPARPVFVEEVVRKRRQMYERLIQMMQKHGLTVTGDLVG